MHKSEHILSTKFYIPPARPEFILRPRLIEQLNDGLHHRLTLVSAPVGFGKTTLVSGWVNRLRLEDSGNVQGIAWLSLDENDNEPVRFLTYFIHALKQVCAKNVDMGKSPLAMLHSPQPPSMENVLTSLINELVKVSGEIVFVLDDYHVIETPAIDDALGFLLDHLPSNLHLVITSRADPSLPLPRLRARGQVVELRSADLRFTFEETVEFFHHISGLELSSTEIAALENRTEGWIAGLKLAALSMQGREDISRFIETFTGSHRYIVDYLVEEVLLRQTEVIQYFLLCTSILDRLCGPLCDAVLQNPSVSSQETLEYLEQTNLFLVPLDNERHWYRYHHLFADLLRHRLQRDVSHSAGKDVDLTALHIRASQWYEENDMAVEAFQHATLANDIERAERIMDGDGMPLQYRGAALPVMQWLESLPAEMKNDRPSLWVAQASVLTMAGKPVDGIEEILNAAEAALQDAQPNETVRNHIGHVAAIRAMLAIPKNQIEAVIEESQRALEYLHPENLSVRTTTAWTLGFAYQTKGERAAAVEAHTKALEISKASGNTMISIAAATSLGQLNEADTRLYQAVENYRDVLQLAGEPSLPAACEAHLGLARIYYEWDDLDTARKHGELGLQLAQQLENIDTPARCELLLARLKLAQGDADGAIETITHAEQFLLQNSFPHRMPQVEAEKAVLSIHFGDFSQAVEQAKKSGLPVVQARAALVSGNLSEAWDVLASHRQMVEANDWKDETLKAMILQSLVLHAQGENEQAMGLLEKALSLTEPGGYIHSFVDEGDAMARLLTEANAQGVKPEYTGKLLNAFGVRLLNGMVSSAVQPLITPLSQREQEILALIAGGLKNKEIADQMVISLNTVLYHTKNIYSKLGVNKRTQAILKAQELNLL